MKGLNPHCTRPPFMFAQFLEVSQSSSKGRGQGGIEQGPVNTLYSPLTPAHPLARPEAWCRVGEVN